MSSDEDRVPMGLKSLRIQLLAGYTEERSLILSPRVWKNHCFMVRLMNLPLALQVEDMDTRRLLRLSPENYLSEYQH